MAIRSLPCGGGRDERGLPTSRTCLAKVVTQLIVKTGFVYVLKNRQGWRNGQVGARERRGMVRGSVTYWRDWSWAVGGRLWTEMEEPWIYWGACTWSQRQWDANFWLVQTSLDLFGLIPRGSKNGHHLLSPLPSDEELLQLPSDSQFCNLKIVTLNFGLKVLLRSGSELRVGWCGISLPVVSICFPRKSLT